MTVSCALSLALSDDQEDREDSLAELRSLTGHRLTGTREPCMGEHERFLHCTRQPNIHDSIHLRFRCCWMDHGRNYLNSGSRKNKEMTPMRPRKLVQRANRITDQIPEPCESARAGSSTTSKTAGFKGPCLLLLSVALLSSCSPSDAPTQSQFVANMEQTEATLGVDFSIATGETVGCNSLHYVGYASNEGQEIDFGAWGAKNPAFTTDIGEKWENGEAIIVVTDEMVLYSEGSCARRTIEQFDDPIRDYPTLWETREEELSETYEMEGWTINVLRYRYERVPDNERNLVDRYSVAVEYVNNGGTQRPVWKSACGTKLHTSEGTNPFPVRDFMEPGNILRGSVSFVGGACETIAISLWVNDNTPTGHTLSFPTVD